ncbi:MAG: 1,4-dihydroxy-2-naphthoate polyprenyltransferase [Anaerolineales bacterium]|nr:1,4-dihydroxy-2-naphthoate polyprenyltransferase [Anaerolineales bacterium]
MTNTSASAELPSLTRRQAWWLAIRPKTLPAAVGPVLVGIGLAVGDNVFNLLPALAALAGALLLQIASNLANDYYDFVKGYDQADRKGPTRVAASGLISLRELRLGLLVVLALAAVVGAYLIWVGGLPILIIGVAGMISAIIYSGGPFPLSANGLGDLFVFVFFGLAAVVGTYYVQALTVTPEAWIAAIAPGTLITAILVVNNLRDIDTDARAGKHTLAVRFGAAGARAEYTLLLALAFATPLVMLAALALQASLQAADLLALLPWLTLPKALRLRSVVYSAAEGPTLNKTLAGTAQLSLWFSALFAAGLAASGLL